LEREKDQTSTVTVVLFDGSSNGAYKIATQRTVGLMGLLTTPDGFAKAGMTYIQALDLSKMCGINGLKITEVTKENGNEL
jgi:hypothetical protein